MDAIVIMRGYKKRFGMLPNILNPRTFNEKVVWRQLFDRRAILTQLADKYAVRKYVTDRIGGHVLTTLYWVTTTPEDTPFDDLPNRFVVKPTHGSGWFRVVQDKRELDRIDLVHTCRQWLRDRDIEPRVLVEELISDGTGVEANRYKMFVFGGSAPVIMVISGPRDDLRCGFYNRFWEDIGVTYAETTRTDKPLPRPPHLDEMLRYAEILGARLDFVRVDLYDTPAKVYFGEITTTPMAGRSPFDVPEFDRYLGAWWGLPRTRTPIRRKETFDWPPVP